jgi:transposase InsO family protein
LAAYWRVTIDNPPIDVMAPQDSRAAAAPSAARHQGARSQHSSCGAGPPWSRQPRPAPPPPRAGHCVVGRPEPNDQWCADYKGEFQLADKRYCYPLTVTDYASLLLCEALDSTREELAMRAFDRLFNPRIRPGHPQQNVRHERMRLTLKQQSTRSTAVNLLQQQAEFDAFPEEFNGERPPEALQMKAPAEVFRPALTAVCRNPIIRFRTTRLWSPAAADSTCTARR